MDVVETGRCCQQPQPPAAADVADPPAPPVAATESVVESFDLGASGGGGAGSVGRRPLVFDKMESLVREMQDPENGVPVRSQKLFLTSIPSAFMGYDLIEWLMERLNIEDSIEAIHMANLLCQHGYFFPVGECNKNLSVKDDSSLYRFQTPYYWPSQNHNPENSEYVIYLYKRSLRNKQKHGLEDYELEALNKLKKQMAHKWEFIVMQAEEQVRQAKDRKKGDKIVTDSQERAYWRAYRPPPSFLNCLEQPPYPNCPSWASSTSSSAPSSSAADVDSAGASATRKWKNIDEIMAEVEFLRSQSVRARIKVSAAAETLQQHCATYVEYDPFQSPPQPSNPWLSDDPTFWIFNASLVEVPTEKRAKRWAISIEDLVMDQTGLQELTNYLRKEYSHENIRFWLATNQLRSGPASRIQHRVQEIYHEFLAPGAPCEINIDGRTMETVQHEMRRPSRFTFDKAAEHVYNLLLKKDCYPRFVRSEHYKQLLANALQPSQKKRFFSFGATGKKKSIVAASACGPAPPGGMQQLSLACGSSLRRRGSGSERSLSGSPPDHHQPAATPCPSSANSSLLLASSSVTTAAASAGINSNPALSPSTTSSNPERGDDCDAPYRSSSSSDSPPVRLSSGRSTEREDVCPWESVSPPLSLTKRSSRALLTPAPSVDLASPARASLTCSVGSHPSADLDICPWESVAAPPASTGRTKTPVPQQKSSTEVVPDDAVCPWETQTTPTPDSLLLQTHAISKSETVSVNVSKQASPPVVVASSSQRRKVPLATALSIPVAEEAADNLPGASQQSVDKSPAKISDICPWEDEESCKLDQPFVKTYATLGYL